MNLRDYLGDGPPPIKYEFTPDSDKVLEQKGDVYFNLVLQDIPPIHPTDARREINKITNEIGFMQYNWVGKYICCRTDKDSFESLFQVELEFNPKRKGNMGYTQQGYRALGTANVRDELSDVIKSAYLNYTR